MLSYCQKLPVLSCYTCLPQCQQLAHNSVQYGLPEQLDQLESEQRDILSDAFSSMPDWATKGPLCFEDPGAACSGRIRVDLFKKEAPKAVENFLCLCTGERGLGKSSKKPLHYKVQPLACACSSMWEAVWVHVKQYHVLWVSPAIRVRWHHRLHTHALALAGLCHNHALCSTHRVHCRALVSIAL